MRRPSALMLAVGAGAAALACGRHLRSHARGVDAPGGILMGDAVSYDTATGLLLGSFFESIAADVAARLSPGARILEIGCGPGHLSIRLARRGMEVTGLDLDPEMIERARVNASRKASAGRLPTFVVGDVAALPFEANSFDAIVSTLSMHHWADPAVGLAEIARVLHPDGRAFVWDIRPGAVPLHREAPDPVEHVHEAPLRLVDARPWRWPWRFRLTERIELAPLDRSAS